MGFTSQSEDADPEDVDRMLEAYFALARDAIERHGGVVEKFIGDAVHGVFGVPVAHEDDPLRAVRAGLEICGGATSLTAASGAPLRLRVGVNTGEAFVHLDVKPESGEHILVGDAVNTAARIQSAAPEQGVAVGSRTWEATRMAFDYEEIPPASLKGKAFPVRLFHARAERTTRGADSSRSHAGRYVGRVGELASLRAAYDAVRASGHPRLAIIAGEPGIGKSRMLAELAAHVGDFDPAVTWRQGRCLPYGDGTGFWSLGEIVKTHAGILEGEDADVAHARLAATVEGLPESDWIRDRVAPLLGLAGGQASGEESSAAWVAYLRAMARTGPAVITFEDVHWADPALLAFVEQVATVGDAPLLIVVTARPDLFEVTPGFGTNVPGAVRIDLQPLGDDETEALVVVLLGSAIPEELQHAILRRAEGNPLYAEELVRLLGDRDLLVYERGEYRFRPGATIPLPESIHGLLASRLDTLRQLERSIIAAAAVVGAVFWAGAVAAVAGEEMVSVREAVASLTARQLVRRAPTSSMAGEDEYSFWHVLARDVAYGTQPRGIRLARHLEAASWIRARGGRREDAAGVVAHHLSTALELAIAAGDPRADAIRPEARSALADAAANAMTVDVEAAVGLYARALELAPSSTPERSELLRGYGVAASRSARYRESLDALEEALALAEASGDAEVVAQTMLAMRPTLQALQDHRWVTLPAEAERILQAQGPSATLVDVLISRAGASLWDWSFDDVRAFADRAIAMAEQLGLPVPPRAIAARGQARAAAGDAGGLDDLDRAVEIAVKAGNWDQATGILVSYSALAGLVHGRARAVELTRRAIAMSDTHGLRSTGYVHRTDLAGALLEAGELDEAAGMIDDIVEPVDASGEVISAAWLFGYRCQIALIRGDIDTAKRPLSRLVAIVDAHPDQDDLHPPRIMAAAVFHELGQPTEGIRLLRAVLATPVLGPNLDFWGGAAARLAIALGDLELADAVLSALDGSGAIADLSRRSASAMIAEGRSDCDGAASEYLDVAGEWMALETPFEAALAYLGAARCLIALERDAEARAPIESARELFTNLGAAPSLAAIAALSHTEPDTAHVGRRRTRPSCSRRSSSG